MEIDPNKFVFVFPSFALANSTGGGIVIQSVGEQKLAVVLFTDSDLCNRYREEHALLGSPIQINTAPELALFLSDLPENITHAAIDPKSAGVYCPTIERIVQTVLNGLH